MLFHKWRPRLKISIQIIVDSLALRTNTMIKESTKKTINFENNQSLTRMQESKTHQLLQTTSSKIKIFKIGQNSIFKRKLVKNTRLKIIFLILEKIMRKICIRKSKIQLKPMSSTGRTKSWDRRILQIRSLSRVTVEFFLKITKSKSKLSFASNGWHLNLAHTTIHVPSLTESMSFKRRNMFHQDTRPNYAASSWRRQGAHTARDVNSSTRSKSETSSMKRCRMNLIVLFLI